MLNVVRDEGGSVKRSNASPRRFIAFRIGVKGLAALDEEARRCRTTRSALLRALVQEALAARALKRRH